MNKMSAHIMAGFLPYLSEIGPAISAPKKAPSNAKETTSSLYTIVISGHVSLKYSCAPAITPVSYPNSKPPIEPTRVSLMMNDILYSYSQSFLKSSSFYIDIFE